MGQQSITADRFLHLGKLIKQCDEWTLKHSARRKTHRTGAMMSSRRVGNMGTDCSVRIRESWKTAVKRCKTHSDLFSTIAHPEVEILSNGSIKG